MRLEKKIARLKQWFSQQRRVAVALSGGVDSSLLAHMAHDVLKDDSIAITVDTLFVPSNEIKKSAELAHHIGIEHTIITIPELGKSILANPTNRCYLCKKSIFKKILETAEKKGFNRVLDGSNLDDLNDDRPGMKALEELNIRCPFLDTSFTKDDIRTTSKRVGLPTWNKPSMACLATRIPFNRKITESDLERIHSGERILIDIGFRQVRIRLHEDMARIEVDPQERDLFFNTLIMDEIHQRLTALGFSHVTLDLKGYISGNKK